MEETKEIINNEVIITTKVDLGEFIEQKQQELTIISEQINSLSQRQNTILEELSKLIK